VKSYFARLASRAAPSTGERPSAVHTSRPAVANPFEQVAGIETQAGPNTSAHINVREASPISEMPVSKKHLEAIAFSPTQLNAPTAIAPERNFSREDMANLPATERTSESHVISVREKPSQNDGINRVDDRLSTTKRISRSGRKPSAVAEHSIIHSISEGNDQVVGNKPIASGKLAAQANTADSFADKDNIEAERSAQLRKADSFMRELLQPQTAAHSRQQNEEDSSTHVIERPRNVEDHSFPMDSGSRNLRLTPRESDVAIPQPRTESTSLVIGQLTVEIEPSPQLVMQQKQLTGLSERVVVIHSGGERHSGVPSGRRFGLNQY
jgi:hypothetical protein